MERPATRVCEALIGQVLLQLAGDVAGTVVGEQLGRCATLDEQIGQGMDHVLRGHSPPTTDRQTFPRVLIHDRQDANRPLVMGALEDEVVRRPTHRKR